MFRMRTAAVRHWHCPTSQGNFLRAHPGAHAHAHRQHVGLSTAAVRKAVVIGGGVVGASVLYHLAKLGWTDALLLERKVLTAGSTWHAAGGFHALASDPNVSALQAYTIGLYKELEAASGQSCGLHFTGGVNVASDPARWEFLQNEFARHRTMGIESRLLSPAEVKALCPIMNVDDVIGGLFDANEGHLDCSGVTWAYVKSAQKLGASAPQQHAKVERMHQREDDGLWELTIAVDQDKPEASRRPPQTLLAEHVINAGGLWAREVGAMAGVHVPILPMSHHYVVTEPIPELDQGRVEEIPMCIDLDGESYLRGERGGVLLGVYEQDCKPWAADETPWSYGETDLLPPELDRIMPQLEQSLHRYPALSEAGYRTVLNGPFTFAGDGNPLVGPVEGTGLGPTGISNYWVTCGVAGGVGLTVAEWMVLGEPVTFPNVLAMDVARYGKWASKAYTLAKAQENYTRRFRLSYPTEELPAARNVKRTPMFDVLSRKGAFWGASFGLEYPKYFARPGCEAADLPEVPSYHRSNAFDAVAEEVRALRTGVGLVETGTFSKFEVSGPGAQGWLDGLLAARVPRPGRMCLAPMLSPRGKVLGDLTLLNLGGTLGGDRFWLVGSGALQNVHVRWFSFRGAHDSPAQLAVRNITDEALGFAVSGPRSRDLLQRVLARPDDLSAARCKFMDVSEMDVGVATAVVARVSVTGELGYEITVPAAQMRAVYDALVAADADLGLGMRNVGAYALTSARMEKGFGSASAEYTAEFSAPACGLDRFVHASKKADFVGKRAFLRDRDETRAGKGRRLVQLTVPAFPGQTSDPWGYEPLFVKKAGQREPVYCGFTTSGAYGHHVQQSIALAYVDMAAIEQVANGEADLTMWLLGKPVAVELHTQPIYDPQGHKMARS